MRVDFNGEWVGKESPHSNKNTDEKEAKGVELKINPEFEKLIPKLSSTEEELLEKSLFEEGCRDALVTWNGTIVDGHNRYKYCKVNGIPFKTIEKHFTSEDDAKLWMIKNQLARRNLITAARIRLEGARQQILSKEAKERQGKRNDLENIKDTNISEIFRESSNQGKVSEEIAKIAGVSDRTVEKYNYIAKNSEEDIVNQMCEGALDEEGKKMSIASEYNKLKKKERLEELRHKGFPLNKYSVLYADGKDLSVSQMKKYPVNEMAKESSILFLWAFVPHLEESMELLKHWGFQYATTLLWDFVTPYSWGCIDLTHEFLLVGHKGDWTGVVPEKEEKLPSLSKNPRRGDMPSDSRPEEYKAMIHKLYPNDKKIDLFSQEPTDGWEIYNQENNAKNLWR